MKRFLIIGLMLSLVLNSFCQTFTLKAYVKDAVTLSPIKNVNISIYGTNKGTSTDDSGFFSIECKEKPNKIIISHINYYSKEISNLNNSKNNEILLQPKINELKIVSISSDPIINITKELPIYIKDYLFINENICLLAYNRKKINDIRLYFIDKDANILNELKIEKAEELFKDCFGEIYYLTHEEAVRLSISKDTIIELNSIPRNYFDISYKALEFRIEDNIYFSTKHYQNLIIKYHYINLYDEAKEIHTIFSIADSLKISEFERDFNFFFYAKNASKLGMSITSIYNNLDLLREYQPLDWADLHGRFSALETTVNNIKDSIYVFNYTKENIEVYNLTGNLKRKANCTFFKDENFTGKIIISDENKVFALYKIGSIIQLREIDIINGTIKKTFNIPSYPYIENIKLTGNQIYFLYKKRVNQELKQLYRMELV